MVIHRPIKLLEQNMSSNIQHIFYFKIKIVLELKSEYENNLYISYSAVLSVSIHIP